MKGPTEPRDLVAADSSRRMVLWSILIVLVVAGLVRGIYLWESQGDPTYTVPVIDAHTYDQRARELVAGGPLNEAIFWQPIFYPVVLAGVYRASDGSVLAARVLQAVLGCLTCVLVVLLGRRLFGLRAGLLAGLLLALNGPSVLFATQLLSAGWASFWSVVLILLFLRARDDGRWWLLVGLGLSAAISVLVRTTFLPFLLVSSAWLVMVWWRQGSGWAVLGLRLAWLLCGWSLVLLPVTVISKQVTGRVVIVPPSGGINLYIGNNPDFDQTITVRPGRAWTRLRALPERDGQGGDVFARQRYYVERVQRFAREQPGVYLEGLASKALHLISARELSRNVDVYLMRQWSPLLSGLVWRQGGFGFPFGLLLPLAVIGLIGAWPRVPPPVKFFLLLFSLAVIGFFTSARYRLVLVPVICVLAGGGVFLCWELIRACRWHRLSLAALLAISVVMLATLPGPFAQEEIDLEPELYFAVGFGQHKAGHWAAAVPHLQRAIALRYDYPEAHNFLGISLYHLGRLKEAVRHFQAAARLDPEFRDAQNSLAVVAEDRERSLREAWRLATTADAAQRQPGRAVQFADQARALSLPEDPCSLAVAAVAHAAAGRMEEAAALAVRAQTFAATVPLCPEISPRLGEALEVVAAGQHFRE